MWRPSASIAWSPGGRASSVPTATNTPSLTATPPRKIPAGVTTNPFRISRSARAAISPSVLGFGSRVSGHLSGVPRSRSTRNPGARNSERASCDLPDDVLGDHLQVLDAGLGGAGEAVDGEADPVEPHLVPRPQQGLDAILRRAVDGPVVQAVLEPKLERDHARFLHLPRAVHMERLLEVLAGRLGGVLLALANHQAARGAQDAHLRVARLAA